MCGGGAEVDSAHASIADIADWLDVHESRLDGCGGHNSTTARAELGQEIEFSGAEQAGFKLPDIPDISCVNALDEAFLNEESMLTPMCALPALGTAKNQMI